MYSIFITKKELKKRKNIYIPPKSHVYLDGPKSRSYELSFAWQSFHGNLLMDFETFILWTLYHCFWFSKI